MSNTYIRYNRTASLYEYDTSVAQDGSGPWLAVNLGMFLDIRTMGAKCDGTTDDSTAIQAALNSGYSSIFFPALTTYTGTTSLTVPANITLIGCNDNLTAQNGSMIKYGGTGSALIYNSGVVNSSGYAMVRMRDITIFNSRGDNTNTGAAIDIKAGGYAFFSIVRMRARGPFKFGIILDAAEMVLVQDTIIENSGPANSVGIWIVNGPEHTASQSQGFSNAIFITGNVQLNGPTIGICDDGGDQILLQGVNANGHGKSLHMAGRTDFTIENFSMENLNAQTDIANMLFSDRSGVTGTDDKGPCSAGSISACGFFSGVIAGGNSLLQFQATTAGAFHRSIRVENNVFANALGRSAAIDVTRLGWSFCGFNKDNAGATVNHYTGVHNDANGNVLLTGGLKAVDLFDVHGRTDIPTIFSGDIYTEPLTDWTPSSTIVGWASFTAANKIIKYWRIGKHVFVEFHIEGTSNSVNITFTVPYTSAALATNSPWANLLTYTKDNGVASNIPGLAYLPASSTTVSVYKDSTYAAWTNVGAKWIEGQFHYIMA